MGALCLIRRMGGVVGSVGCFQEVGEGGYGGGSEFDF